MLYLGGENIGDNISVRQLHSLYGRWYVYVNVNAVQITATQRGHNQAHYRYIIQNIDEQVEHLYFFILTFSARAWKAWK